MLVTGHLGQFQEYLRSLGLWGPNGKAISPADLSAALAASIEGGARHIWVTPNDQITDAHWNEVLRRWLVPLKPQPAPTALKRTRN